MYSHITKDYISTHHFMGDGLSYDADEVCYRLRSDSPNVIAISQKQTELRIRLSELTAKKYGRNHDQFNADTIISWELFRKCISGRRQITRDMLAKLCVGMSLPLSSAEELFRLQGHSLEPDLNLLDALVVDALNCHDDINTFYEECEEMGLKLFHEKN